MNFSSINFLFLFLPVILPAYFFCPPKFRNIILIFFSFLFYFLGEKVFTLLLLFSCVFNWFIGKNIEKSCKNKWLILGITVNILLLAVFKYLNFFIDQINLLHIFPLIEHSKIHLPVGISFFTFQAISYLIDIKRKEIKPANLEAFTLYLSSFPQLVAGPIVRYKEIQDKIFKREITTEGFEIGVKRFISGLAKKVIIADTLSYTVDSIFSLNAAELSTAVCLLGAVCYTFQIFFDFSGYSDMAIGLGRMFGFKFPENFNYPYISRSIREFWRRWHMTLSGWFRDYLYISLGGSRKGSARTAFNIMVVFALTGLWHGASWNFIVWGLLNGVLIVFERFFHIEKMPKALGHIYFIFAVVTGWVIFRSENMYFAASFLKTLYSFDFANSSGVIYYFNRELIFTLLIAFLFSIPLFGRVKKYMPALIQNAAYCMLLVISAAYIAVNTYQPFIYFRF
ncbi:MAG: MBOAT family protein [Candidatus Gastranaerophilales bacterium]|nr:MBOAT family protein [Candidatus Gastranaerophilales bacterium]